MAAADLEETKTQHLYYLAEHKLCAKKAELTQKVQATKGSHPFSDEIKDDAYYKSLLPEDAEDLVTELISFAKDLDSMDLEGLLIVQTLALRELRVARVKINLIESRIKLLAPLMFVGWTAVNAEVAESQT